MAVAAVAVVRAVVAAEAAVAVDPAAEAVEAAAFHGVDAVHAEAEGEAEAALLAAAVVDPAAAAAALGEDVTAVVRAVGTKPAGTVPRYSPSPLR